MFINNSTNSAESPKNVNSPKYEGTPSRLVLAYPDSKYRVPLNHRLEFIHSIFLKTFSPGHMFPGEKHGYWEMMYVMDGNLSATEDSIVYNMKKGDIIFHKPYEFHSFKVNNDSGCTIMVVTFSIDSNLIDALGNGIYKLNDELHDSLVKCYNHIKDGFMVDFTYIRKKNLDHDSITEALAILSLEKFLLEVISTAKKRVRVDNSTSAENYRRIMEVLSEHVKERLTIEDVAKYCQMTPSNLKKTFGKYSGHGILKYFNLLKITRAKEMLKMGYTADFISTYLGYSSPSYFSRAFKNEVGVSPLHYKKNL